MPSQTNLSAQPKAEKLSTDLSGNGKGLISGAKRRHTPSTRRTRHHSPIGELPDPVLSENAVTVLQRRYLKKDSRGRVVETPKEMFWRAATALVRNEKRYHRKIDTDRIARDFYQMMASLDFLPNSPTLMNAGRRLGQLSACFVLPVNDTMEGIFEAVKQAALVHKSGGGTGFSFSRLRPRASMVQSTAGTASGPVSFMTVFNAATETIKQGGTRRGANMGILLVNHPDIRDFITCKRDMTSITNFNISVAVTDDFMEALQKGKKYKLIAPHTGKMAAREDAREIFSLIAENAWLNGDPGIVFLDEINRHEPTPHIGLVEATNPCGEQPLLAYESCNLGSLNLNNMLTTVGEIDWEHLRRTTRLSVRLLDNIVDLNRYPVEEIRVMTQSNRRIGLGIMGFADMLFALQIPYDSEEAVQLGQKVMKFIISEAREMSDELAVERGPFPNWEGSIFDHPTRNSTVTTIAPTGTISMIADTSGGIEPSFALVYVKRVMDDDRLLYINRRFEEAAKASGFYSQELMKKIADGKPLSELDEVPPEARRVFVTAHDISPEWHIRMQAAFQEFCENAVSKTINFPHSATVEDVKKSYLLAWELKCKGITIYRDGSRTGQVLNRGTAEAKKDKAIKPARSAETADETTQDEQAPSASIRSPGIGRPYLKPRPRPSITNGYTEQIRTAEGTLFVTINEDVDGLCEVFASIGKSGGGAAAQSEAIGRLISLALRSGIAPREIVKQLKGISGPNPIWHEGELIRSTPDAIGKALERYLDRKEKRQAELPLEVNHVTAEPSSTDEDDRDEEPNITFAYGVQVRELCPDCQSPVIFEEGCLVCKRCGYSKCG